MPKVISIHEYLLKPEANPAQFERAIQAARQSGLLQLPGLVNFYLLKGLKGTRRKQYAAIWIYESREAWEDLWGTPENPLEKTDYPVNWKQWEDQILAPFLIQDPDRITFTAYEEL